MTYADMTPEERQCEDEYMDNFAKSLIKIDRKFANKLKKEKQMIAHNSLIKIMQQTIQELGISKEFKTRFGVRTLPIFTDIYGEVKDGKIILTLNPNPVWPPFDLHRVEIPGGAVGDSEK